MPDDSTVIPDPAAPPVDPNAPPADPANPPVDPATDPNVVYAAEFTAKSALDAAVSVANAANADVTSKTLAEAATNAALGGLVNGLGGLGIINPDGTIKVLLPNGNGTYHPVTVPGIKAPS